MPDQLGCLFLVQLPLLFHVLVELTVERRLQNQIDIVAVGENSPQLYDVVAAKIGLNADLSDELVQPSILF